MTIQSWWLKGRSDVVQSIMGSSGSWDSSSGGQADIMSGSALPGISPVELPYLMSSPGNWDTSLGGFQGIMSGSAPAGVSSVQLPYLMRSPGQWDPSLGGPQDIMGARLKPRSTSSLSAQQPASFPKLPNLGDRQAA